jgi:hypothetical protein
MDHILPRRGCDRKIFPIQSLSQTMSSSKNSPRILRLDRKWRGSKYIIDTLHYPRHRTWDVCDEMPETVLTSQTILSLLLVRSDVVGQLQ